jgi:transketolase
MRGTFIRTLTELAEKDRRIFLLTGDLGFMALEPFIERFPDRYINVGVAEQNMVGLATGLAEAGFIPFCYSIVTFACLRPYEFIRNGPLAHRLPVRIVGVGGGMEYGHNGVTHYGLEDIAVMRTQPGMTLVAPADAAQTANALKQTYQLPGAVYYRLGKDDRIPVPGLDGRFSLGNNEVVRDGRDILVISTGAITVEACKMADQLAAQGVGARVVVVSTLNPAPTQDLVAHLRDFRRVIAVEAHYQNGGLGSLVAETIAENRLNCTLVRRSVQDMPDGTSGSQAFMQRKNGIDDEALITTAKTMMAEVWA